MIVRNKEQQVSQQKQPHHDLSIMLRFARVDSSVCWGVLDGLVRGFV